MSHQTTQISLLCLAGQALDWTGAGPLLPVGRERFRGGTTARGREAGARGAALSGVLGPNPKLSKVVAAVLKERFGFAGTSSILSSDESHGLHLSSLVSKSL